MRLFLAGEALLALGTAIVSLLMNLHWSALGRSPAAIGGLWALQSAAVALLALPASVLADRLGRRRLLLAGTGLVSLGVALATAPAPGLATAGQLLAGAGWMAVLVVEFPVVLQYARDPREHVLLFSLVVGTFTLFLGVGTPLAGALPDVLAPASSALGARTPYQLPLLLGATLTGAASLVRARMAVPEPGAPRGLPVLRPDPAILRLLPPAVLMGVAFGTVAPFMNLIMVRRFASDEDAIGAVLTVGGLMLALGSAAGPPLAARLGEARAVGASLGLHALVAALMALPVPLPAFAAAHWLRVAAFAAGANVAEGRMFGAVPDGRRALYAGYRTLGGQAGQTLASAAAGLALERGLTGLPFLLAAGGALAYGAYYLAAVRPRLDPAPGPRPAPAAERAGGEPA